MMECFPSHRSTGSILKDRKAEALTVRQLRRVDRTRNSPRLEKCTVRYGGRDFAGLRRAHVSDAQNGQGIIPCFNPEIRNKSLCTDPTCYQAKIQALVQLRVEPLVKEGQNPVRISESPSWHVHSNAPGTLYEGQYHRAEREGECPQTQAAIIVDGRKAGTILHICADEKCKTHQQFSHYQVSPQEREQRRKLALAIRVQKESRSLILQAIRQKLPPALARADFEMVGLDYFRRLVTTTITVYSSLRVGGEEDKTSWAEIQWTTKSWPRFKSGR